MKKLIVTAVLSVIFSAVIFADEKKSFQQDEVKFMSDVMQEKVQEDMPKTVFVPMITVMGAYLPNSDMLDVNIPFFMPMLQAHFSHQFTDSGKNPELTFVSDAELSPLWLKIESNFEFKPLPFISLSAGGSIGTSWGADLGFLSIDFIGEYDSQKKEYNYFSPFSHWVYEGWAQVGFMYDLGSLFFSGKHHLVFDASYRIK
ncbi:MAG: hypothetical protein K6G00_09275, partial [Treponema sp.]|nr:hypothetical protein [Treponema sp.]